MDMFHAYIYHYNMASIIFSLSAVQLMQWQGQRTILTPPPGLQVDQPAPRTSPSSAVLVLTLIPLVPHSPRAPTPSALVITE